MFVRNQVIMRKKEEVRKERNNLRKRGERGAAEGMIGVKKNKRREVKLEEESYESELIGKGGRKV